MSRHYTRDVSLYFIGQLFQQVINFTTGLLVARWLGPQEYGSLGIARNIYAMALILGPLGLDVALLRLIPQTTAEDLPKLVGRIRAVRLVTLIANALIVAGTVATAGPLEHGVYHAPHLGIYLILTMSALPFAADLNVMAAVYRARGDTGPQIILTMIAQPVVRVIALIVLIMAGWGVIGVVTSNLIGSLVTFLLLSGHFFGAEHKDGAPYTTPPLFERRYLGSVFSYSLWLAIMNIAYNMLRNVDILVLGTARNATVVGNYVALSVLAQVIQIYPQALSQTLGPSVASAYARGDFGQVRAALNTYLRRASLTVGPLAGGLASFGPWLDLLFGHRFSFSPELCLTLSFAYVVSGVLGPLGYGLSMTGRHRRELMLLVVGGVVAIGGCILLVRPFGAVGVAVGVTSAYVLINTGRGVFTARAFGFIPGELRDLLPPLASVAVGMAIRIAWDRFLPHTLVWTGLAVVLYLGTIAVLYGLFILAPGERNWVISTIRRRLPRRGPSQGQAS